MRIKYDGNSLTTTKGLKAGDIIDFAYKGLKQAITLVKGTYTLEVWGAQGGYRNSSSYSGNGGYAKGTLTLTADTQAYVYSGGQGGGSTSATSIVNDGGFNGGGKRYGFKGGGGASDIRLLQDSLYARVIVAGGGGSCGGSGAYPDGSGDDDRGGGGGSGFVWTGSNAPTGYLLNSTYYLTSTSLVGGNSAFTSPTGSSETGHTGDGYARITVVEIASGAESYIKRNNQWVKGDSFSVKINSQWKSGEIFIKVNGEWKQ